MARYFKLAGSSLLGSISLPDVVFGSDVTADNSTTYMSFFSQMDTYGDGYAGIGVWRAAFKPLVDRIADTDIRLQYREIINHHLRILYRLIPFMDNHVRTSQMHSYHAAIHISG